jgi:hypothetical protein
LKISFKDYLLERDYNSVSTRLEYHDTLNPALWRGTKLNEKVAEALKRIAREFISTLEIPVSSVIDIVITGSNCSFNYSSLSDLDVHLIIDEKLACPNCRGSFIEDCFRAKKTVWNSTHNIKVKGYPVELYAQPKDDKLVAAGIYSLQQNAWLKKPKHRTDINVNDSTVKAKADEFMALIDDAIDANSTDRDFFNDIKAKIKRLRQTGLEKKSEFSTENLAFKAIRNNGYLDKLDNYMKDLTDKSLSLK